MSSPWLDIPLEDYEGHMAMPDVGQAVMLASEFTWLLDALKPTSVAVVGCAGGNGFQEAVNAGVSRIVGLDINPAYLANAQKRFAGRISGLELYCADVEQEMPHLSRIQVLYAALIFEYVNAAKTLKNLYSFCHTDGILAAVLQMPIEEAANISPSPFLTLRGLSSVMRLVPPLDFRAAAEEVGFAFLSEKLITLESRKQFSLQLFRKP